MTPPDPDPITAKDLILPAMLCAASFSIALALAIFLGLRGTDILLSYGKGSFLPAVIMLLFWCALPFWRAPRYRALPPIKAGRMLLQERWLLLSFPLLLTPVFNTSYTVSKTAFPFFTGFRWDRAFADLDRALFGVDPWRITHAVLGPLPSEWIVYSYTIVWGIALLVVLPAMLCWAPPRTAIRAHLSFMLIWFFGGVVGAALFSSAGPVFAILSDQALADHFAPLHTALGDVFPRSSIVLHSQAYLQGSFGKGTVESAAGISAMPSMHLATAALYVVMAQRTRFFIPAITFWLIMWIGSVHLGYHYAVDGIAGALIAWAAWRVTAPRSAYGVTARAPQFAIA